MSALAEHNGMDAWDLKKWRKKLGYNQFEAASQLGVGRASIQNWEQEHRPIPRVTELACHQILRRWKQRPDFGPVLVVYADGSIWQRSQEPYQIGLLKADLYTNNRMALQHVNRQRVDPNFTSPFIMDNTGEIVWTPFELRLPSRARPVYTESD